MDRSSESSTLHLICIQHFATLRNHPRTEDVISDGNPQRHTTKGVHLGLPFSRSLRSEEVHVVDFLIHGTPIGIHLVQLLIVLGQRQIMILSLIAVSLSLDHDVSASAGVKVEMDTEPDAGDGVLEDSGPEGWECVFDACADVARLVGDGDGGVVGTV